MKTTLASRFGLCACFLVLSYCLTCVRPCSAADQSASDEARRERVAQLESQSRELKQAGEHDEARRAWQEAQELRGQGGREQAKEPMEGVEREMRELRLQIERRRAEGKEAEAAELKERLVEMERRFRSNAPQRRLEMQQRSGEPNPERDGRPARGEAGAEARQRHIRIAAEHLHAAGLHDVAQRVERRAFADRRGIAVMPSSQGLVPLREIRTELEELRRAVHDLHLQLEELRRDRR